jgi:hypothetical protein
MMLHVTNEDAVGACFVVLHADGARTRCTADHASAFECPLLQGAQHLLLRLNGGERRMMGPRSIVSQIRYVRPTTKTSTGKST